MRNSSRCTGTLCMINMRTLIAVDRKELGKTFFSLLVLVIAPPYTRIFTYSTGAGTIEERESVQKKSYISNTQIR